MTTKKQTGEYGSYQIDYGYSRSEDEKPQRSKSTLRKWGEKIVALTAAGAALWGVGEAVSASNESDRKEAVAVGEEFKAAIQPAAQELAEAAKVGYEQSKDGYMIEDTDDPTKYNLSFHHTFKDGSSYRIDAIVGENDQGEADTSKVERAEIVETYRLDGRSIHTSVLTFALKDDVMNGEPQWVASGGVAAKGMEAMGSTTEYNGSVYLDKDRSVASARERASGVDKKLSEIAKKTTSDIEQPTA